MKISANSHSLQPLAEAPSQRTLASRARMLTAGHSAPNMTGGPPPAGKLLGYAMTQRQQVAAYAVIDSMGRGLTQTVGSTVSLFA